MKTELRQGNFIRDIESGRIGFVLVIGKRSATVKMQFSELAQAYEEFEPVPIDEHWLLKLGFIRQPWGLVKGELLFKDRNHKCEELTLEVGNGFRTTVTYVHQLQNLYFALAGEEILKL